MTNNINEQSGKKVTILGIESSCDETAAAVVRDGRDVLSNVVYTQIPLHQLAEQRYELVRRVLFPSRSQLRKPSRKRPEQAAMQS